MKPSLAVLILAVALATPTLAHAQRIVTASADVGVSVPINAYLNLSSSSITIPTPTAADVAAGVSKPGYITLSYGSNGSISLGYLFTSGDHLQSAGSSPNLSIGRLRVAVDGGPPETMTEYGTQWRSGIPAGDHVETLAFTVALDYTVQPDVYSATWEVTLSAN